MDDLRRRLEALASRWEQDAEKMYRYNRYTEADCVTIAARQLREELDWRGGDVEHSDDEEEA